MSPALCPQQQNTTKFSRPHLTSTHTSGGTKGHEVCCASNCGGCGGTGCDKSPGGAASCCGGAIFAANNSCNTHTAPCTLDVSYMSPVAAHASVSKSDGTIRILLIAKDLTSHEDANIDVCVRGATVKAIATAKTLVASNGDVASKVSLMNTSTSFTSPQYVATYKLLQESSTFSKIVTVFKFSLLCTSIVLGGL